LVLYWYFSTYTRMLAAPLLATFPTTTSSGTMALEVPHLLCVSIELDFF